MRKWIILFVLVTLWGYGGIQALSLNTADGRIFMYYREGEGPRAEELDRALGREQGETAGTEREDQGGSVYPELCVEYRSNRGRVHPRLQEGQPFFGGGGAAGPGVGGSGRSRGGGFGTV